MHLEHFYLFSELDRAGVLEISRIAVTASAASHDGSQVRTLPPLKPHTGEVDLKGEVTKVSIPDMYGRSKLASCCSGEKSQRWQEDLGGSCGEGRTSTWCQQETLNFRNLLLFWVLLGSSQSATSHRATCSLVTVVVHLLCTSLHPPTQPRTNPWFV